MPHNTLPADFLLLLQQSGLDDTTNLITRLESIGGYQAPIIDDTPTDIPTSRPARRFTVSHGNVSVCPNAFVLSAYHNETLYFLLHALATYYRITTVSQLYDRAIRNDIPLSRQMFNKLLRQPNLYLSRGFDDCLHVTPTDILHTRLYDRAMRNTDTFTFDNGISAKVADLHSDYKPGTTAPVILPVALSAQERKALALAVLVHTPNNKTVKRSGAYIRAVLGISGKGTLESYKKIATAKQWVIVESGGISQDNSGKIRRSANQWTSQLKTQHIKLTGNILEVSRYYFESKADYASSDSVARFGCEYELMRGRSKIGYRRLNSAEIQNRTVVTDDYRNIRQLTFDDVISWLDAPKTAPQRTIKPLGNRATNQAHHSDTSRYNPDGSLSSAYLLGVLSSSSRQSDLYRTKPNQRMIELDPKFVIEFAGKTQDQILADHGMNTTTSRHNPDGSLSDDYKRDLLSSSNHTRANPDGRLEDTCIANIFESARRKEQATPDPDQDPGIDDQLTEWAM